MDSANYDQAVAAAKNSIEIDGSHENYGLLARVYAAQGKYKPAGEATRQALDLAKKSSAADAKEAAEMYQRNLKTYQELED